jgi:outer membrane protein assembly factor BamA
MKKNTVTFNDIVDCLMLRERKYCLWFLVAIACCHCVSAQSPGNEDKPPTDQFSESETTTGIPQTFAHGDARFTVRHIIIEGNKKTRASIVLREIPFKTGDQYLLQDLVKKFETARRQLMNTALFHEVVVALKSFEGYDIDILVQVKERWYIFPIPYLKPVDRNINQWLFEQNAKLNRVDYGAKLLYNNATGRNDKLRAWVINGYTKQLSFSYDRLYFDKKMKWGVNIAFAIGKNREMNYNTINNKQVFLKDDSYVRNFVNTSFELTYRRAIKTRHRFGIGYTMEEISDTILTLNPAYFKSGRSRISFPELYYIMTYYDLDYIPYPTKGYAAEISVAKKGFTSTINLWQLSAKGSGNWHIGKKSFFTLGAYGMLKLPFKQPYFNQRLLGYNDVFLQGYEYYVIDGVAAGYLKTVFTRKLFNFNINVPATKRTVPHRIPFNIYGKIYGNAGYVHNPEPGNNFLSNKMLYSGGFGIDIITLYDFTLKLEWSFNQLGQNGLFLHRKSIF